MVLNQRLPHRVLEPWLARLALSGLCWLLLAPVSAQAQTQAQTQAQAAATADWWSAVKRDDASEISSQLLRGADPNAINGLGNPALVQAAREQSWKVFDLLRIAPGIRVDQPNARGETALMYLSILGQTARAAALIQAGAQVNRLGWTPLHYAASKGQVEMAGQLIEWGAIVNAPGPDGTTPLMMAALSGKRAMVRLLLDHGADPTMRNLAHESAADWALKRKNTVIAAELDAAAAHVAQARQARQPAELLPQADLGQIANEKLREAEQPPGVSDAPPAPVIDAPPTKEAPTARDGTPDDADSFSRYFDLGRFDRAPAAH
ncbi:ankyrin repeat domain-containing protein [Castellaniella caeni]|uniref:ankyrin repeat domain-containing protein n=1 Tax=Castellaniella caeni TaxID=266123 RepID=UPI00082E96E8|nr:ankyrin repeat domain-containing protein [Castellaniella caeni]